MLKPTQKAGVQNDRFIFLQSEKLSVKHNKTQMKNGII